LNDVKGNASVILLASHAANIVVIAFVVQLKTMKLAIITRKEGVVRQDKLTGRAIWLSNAVLGEIASWKRRCLYLTSVGFLAGLVSGILVAHEIL
jgi:hypothetical protein